MNRLILDHFRRWGWVLAPLGLGVAAGIRWA